MFFSSAVARVWRTKQRLCIQWCLEHWIHSAPQPVGNNNIIIAGKFGVKGCILEVSEQSWNSFVKASLNYPKKGYKNSHFLSIYEIVNILLIPLSLIQFGTYFHVSLSVPTVSALRWFLVVPTRPRSQSPPLGGASSPPRPHPWLREISRNFAHLTSWESTKCLTRSEMTSPN